MAVRETPGRRRPSYIPRDRQETAMAVLRGLQLPSGASCIFAACIVRDYLREVGIAGRVRVCMLRLVARDDAGEVIAAHEVGAHWLRGGGPVGPGAWDGHAIVVTDSGLLIDAGLQIFRGAGSPWGPLPRVAIVPLAGDKRHYARLAGRVLPVLAMTDPNNRAVAMWLRRDTPAADWQQFPAAQPGARRLIVARLTAEFEARAP